MSIFPLEKHEIFQKKGKYEESISFGIVNEFSEPSVIGATAYCLCEPEESACPERRYCDYVAYRKAFEEPDTADGRSRLPDYGGRQRTPLPCIEEALLCRAQR